MKIKVYNKKNVSILKESAKKFNCELELVREDKKPFCAVFKVSETNLSDIDKMVVDYQDSLKKTNVKK